MQMTGKYGSYIKDIMYECQLYTYGVSMLQKIDLLQIATLTQDSDRLRQIGVLD